MSSKIVLSKAVKEKRGMIMERCSLMREGECIFFNIATLRELGGIGSAIGEMKAEERQDDCWFYIDPLFDEHGDLKTVMVTKKIEER